MSVYDVDAAVDEYQNQWEPFDASLVPALVPSPLAPDAPPSVVDKEFWNGKPLIGACPRGCSRIGDSTPSRVTHYKKQHYDVYFSLLTRRKWHPLERWMCKQFGEEGENNARACLKCVGELRQFLLHQDRVQLAIHMQAAHPGEFLALARDYCCNIYDGRSTSCEVHWMMLNALSLHAAAPVATCTATVAQQQAAAPAFRPTQPWAVAAAAAAAPQATCVVESAPATPSLALNAPPCTIDIEYWNAMTAIATCPRGCQFSDERPNQRREHYRWHHYDVYYAMLQQAMPPRVRWLYTHFGDAASHPRVCVRCFGARRTSHYYSNRMELVRHIQSSHHESFVHMAGEYWTVPGAEVPDEDIHRLLMNTAMIFQ